ncbi:UDP-glucuronic acid decarboxylase 4 [Capsicum baccatum]|uniref:UDP-glucuronic acid decarboxylase 4 n=1 Tax=Capsicum baccatum TaxID=33114 RepID=A0A2G2WMR9_CAPBA|nr:UDP-glucuronic acid decarboxylase 4 [Capsicum baccatum]
MSDDMCVQAELGIICLRFGLSFFFVTVNGPFASLVPAILHCLSIGSNMKGSLGITDQMWGYSSVLNLASWLMNDSTVGMAIGIILKEQKFATYIKIPYDTCNNSLLKLLLKTVIQETIDRNAQIEFRPNTADDPHKRQPDISKAKELLGWEPKVPLRKGLPMMVQDFRQRIFGDHKEDSSSVSSA